MVSGDNPLAVMLKTQEMLEVCPIVHADGITCLNKYSPTGTRRPYGVGLALEGPGPSNRVKGYSFWHPVHQMRVAGVDRPHQRDQVFLPVLWLGFCRDIPFCNINHDFLRKQTTTENIQQILLFIKPSLPYLPLSAPCWTFFSFVLQFRILFLGRETDSTHQAT